MIRGSNFTENNAGLAWPRTNAPRPGADACATASLRAKQTAHVARELAEAIVIPNVCEHVLQSGQDVQDVLEHARREHITGKIATAGLGPWHRAVVLSDVPIA